MLFAKNNMIVITLIHNKFSTTFSPKTKVTILLEIYVPFSVVEVLSSGSLETE